MKYFWGAIISIVLLALAVLGILAIWGIYPVSGDIIGKTLLTVLVTFIAFIILWVCMTFFFKKEKHRNDGNKAHRID